MCEISTRDVLLSELTALRKYRKEAELKISKLENDLSSCQRSTDAHRKLNPELEDVLSQNYRLQSKLEKCQRELANWQEFANYAIPRLAKHRSVNLTVPHESPEAQRFILTDLIEKTCESANRMWTNNPEYKKLRDKYQSIKSQLCEVRTKCDAMLQEMPKNDSNGMFAVRCLHEDIDSLNSHSRHAKHRKHYTSKSCPNL